MSNKVTGSFDPERLTASEREVLLDYYRQVARDMTVKIEQLESSTHTLMSQNALDNLKGIRNEYRRRIEVLVTLSPKPHARKK